MSSANGPWAVAFHSVHLAASRPHSAAKSATVNAARVCHPVRRSTAPGPVKPPRAGGERAVQPTFGDGSVVADVSAYQMTEAVTIALALRSNVAAAVATLMAMNSCLEYRIQPQCVAVLSFERLKA